MKLYLSDIREFFALPGLELLNRSRRERVYRYRRREDQARCLVAGLMLRRVLGEQAASRVSISALGKPYLPNGPCFNLSHSGNKVVLLTDKRTVGVDVELITGYPRSVAEKVFTEVERNWLRSRATDEAFFRLWTGKEAIMKAMGRGFHLPPESFEICPEVGFPNPVGGQSWYLHWIESEEHIICTAAEKYGSLTMPITLSGNELLKK